MPLPSAERLFEHLSVLRDAEDVTAPVLAPHWREVATWLQHAFPGGGSIADRRQETLISLFRCVAGMRAEGPRQAVKWVTTIHRRKRVDALRAIRTDPVQQGLRDSSRHPDAPSPLERLTDDAPPILSSAAIEAVLTATLEQVHLALEETVRSAAKRALRRTQAQAALLRIVCEWDAEAIVAALDYGEPIQRDRLYKWVERGRQPVLAGLERWERTADAETWDSVGVVVETLRELMQERRADAGVPRRARRGASPKEVS